jgi:uncharacterized membrane protein YqjE
LKPNIEAPSEKPRGDMPRGILPVLVSMIGTRLELAALDMEANIQLTLVALITAFIAVVFGLIAFAFIGVAVIVLFWETHRIPAAAAVMLAYSVLAASLAFRARAAWHSRPAMLAATVHELPHMSQGSPKSRSRREHLLSRCQRERYELVAATATTMALIPRARRLSHWIRTVSRMLRVVAASMRAE